MNPGLNREDVKNRMLKSSAGGKLNALKAVKDMEGNDSAMIALGRESKQKIQALKKPIEERLVDYKKSQPLLKKATRSIKKLFK